MTYVVGRALADMLRDMGVKEAFEDGQEMLILVTECTVQADCAAFINTYGCEDYVRHNEGLMLTERGDVLAEEIRSLDL